MPSPYLSKSDFKACFDCRTKLFYRKNEYPTTLDENEYLRFLADGGFMIELVAKARFPMGRDLVDERDPKKAFARTTELINARADAVVFEAAALHDKFYARIDILRREGHVLHLIEVKSSSIKGENDNDDGYNSVGPSPFLNKRGEITTKWREYLLDVAFQVRVLRLSFSNFTVKPWLCIVNKGHAVSANETLDNFRLVRDEAKPKLRPVVEYSGDLKRLSKTKLLLTLPVCEEIALLEDEVDSRANELAALIGPQGKISRKTEDLGNLYKSCRTCEYRFRPGVAPQRHGFGECWGDLAFEKPHILDLHRVTQIGSSKFPDPVPDLLASGRASLLDLKEDQLGGEGSRATRRHIQWSHSKAGGSEYLSQSLKATLNGHQTTPGWPLYFVDFEACDIALPHHAGLRPYERVAFQWSCHTLDKAGTYSHAEWLNTEREFPNFKFAQALRERIGEKGTVYVWSSYEQATLRRILIQIEEWMKRDATEALRVAGTKKKSDLEDVADWIDRLLGPEDAKGERKHSPRIRDLHKLALEHYFHPAMAGRTSIKVVLPAVWGQDEALRKNPWFKDYLKLDAAGQTLDPYKTLPELPLGDEPEDEDAIVDGTGAIRVYQDLIFRKEENPEFRRNRERLLLQYCELDTAAMVMIWKHWVG